ncbi:Ribonuclease H-like domain containing protein [uncultured Caudovirales phage]|uniref:Ribonuclease H-like domain containing protein n=1 Tax=uncultured Caudovirales phage TaxID=2100421 RepID=A0A6J5LQ35_9CAUD|nr:Ribonuclease H-like domain containing protein [uncultured Caudovirales phage]CAB4151927.1 Ribonuclease H-like domain containing protein [uncultured Caudovirales phage]
MANPKFRLKDIEVRKLGLIPTAINRFRLNPQQQRQLAKIREGQSDIKRLFFDIETSPNIGYFWRTGYNLSITPDCIINERKIICISYKWETEDKIYTLTWDENQCDKQMLIDFIKVANQSDEMIAHNGDRFDIKWIRTRCIFHRVAMFPNYKTLDTLKKAKSGFNFNSNKLDYIAQFLGVGAKVKHSGFDMWKNVMAGDKEAMSEMVHYCEGDIIVLEDVFLTMQNYIKTNTHNGVINGNLKYSCPSCGSENIELLKNNVTAMGTIKRQINCLDCEYTYEISNSSYMLYLKFKNLI